MIIFTKAKLKEIFKLGKSFPWKKPEYCLICKTEHLHGHGFTTAYFDGFENPLFIRRYRCPKCGTVYRNRPTGYFPRFQISINSIRSYITFRIKTGRYNINLSRFRQKRWIKVLKQKTLAYLGIGWIKTLISAFNKLIQMQITPVSMSK